jgi:hypothetical protein
MYFFCIATARVFAGLHPAVTVAAGVPGGIALYFAALRFMKVEERRLITGGRF